MDNVVTVLKVNNKDAAERVWDQSEEEVFPTTQDCSFDAILHLAIYAWLQIHILTAKIAPPHKTIIHLSLRGIIFFHSNSKGW